MKAFFDESGNTGTNWLDNSQPFFVYGGWLIDKNKEEFAKKRFTDIFSFSNATELKSKYILEKKKNVFWEFMQSFIYEINAIPVFGIAEKKYMIAAKITETIFDCAYNPYVNEYLTFRSELKSALADCIFEDKELLNDFSELIARGTIDLKNMIDIQKNLGKYFINKELIDVAMVINKLKPVHLLKMIDEFEVMSKNGTEKKWLALTEPILFDRILNIDKYCEIVNKNAVIYVDELSGYDTVFSSMNQIIARKGIVSTISKVEQCNSKTKKLVQAADLLSGYINRCFLNIEIYRNDEESTKIWKDFIAIRDVFSEKGIVIWDYYADNKFLEKIGILAGLSSQITNDTEQIIRTNFPIAIKR